MIWRTVIRRLAFTAAGASAVGVGSLFFLPKVFELANGRDRHSPSSESRRSRLLAASPDQQVASITAPLPTREEQLRRLREDEFDVLVIGGGSAGCGVALDAQTRGLKTALVERADYASGTSGKSTKLIHGGVGSSLHSFLIIVLSLITRFINYSIRFVFIFKGSIFASRYSSPGL